MARKASRRTVTIGSEGSATPSVHGEMRPEEVSERPFRLLKSSDVKSMGNAGAAAALNVDTPSIAGDTDEENEFNDFIECLGYLPPGTEKRVECRAHEENEFNDFIECLGYLPPGTGMK